MNSAKLRADVNFGNSSTEVLLEGTIDEDSPEILHNAFSDLRGTVMVNFRNVKKINSCGIEELMKTLHDISRKHEVRYAECPEVIVDQFQMMDFSMYGRISSFFIRYRCNSCNREEMNLLDVDKDLRLNTNSREIVAPTFSCECDGTLEIDDYVDFLDDHIEW